MLVLRDRFSSEISETADWNLVDACMLCNAKKRDRTVDEYRLWLYESSGPGRSRRLLLNALIAFPEMPNSQQTGLLDAIAYIEENFKLPVFFGEQ